ncbi:MAG: response regulator, partial [Nitrospirota bacterium]|nr:response regulator [Nitrospirota bacterium]
KSLKISNFKVELVNNGEEAHKFLTDLKAKAKAAKKKVSDYLEVVISDIEMPLLDGFTLTKNIKNDAELHDLPVILYSSIITDELRHKGESVRADVQISKPEMNRMAEMAIELIERE